MEVSILNPWVFSELDNNQDPVGLMVEKEIRCGYCNALMEKEGMRGHRCPRCGFST